MENSRNAAPRRGMAIFAVLSLMVVFTVLGVAAITIAQRDNSASGSVFDIKQREAAAYAGLVYAQNELARDPANLLAILENWRQAPTNPSLYLKFDPATKVTLSQTKPAPFQIPGTTSNITVEVAGISLPTTSTEEPNIALRSTGSGSSGDEQTLLGVYQIKNIRRSSNAITMPITHPFYVSGAGSWNSSVAISNGNAFLGNKTHLNGSVRRMILQNAGLRVNGDFELDDIQEFTVDSNVYVNGNFLLHQVTGTLNLRQNVIITGNIEPQTDGVTLRLDSSLYVLGNLGFSIGKALRFAIGKDFYLPNGNLRVENGSWVEVGGSAFIRRLAPDFGKSIALDVRKRLELSGMGSGIHQFQGTGNWGQLVVRKAALLSTIKSESAFSSTYFPSRPASGGIQLLNDPGPSWVATDAITIGSPGNRLRLMPNSTTTLVYTLGQFSPVYLESGNTGTAVTLVNWGKPAEINGSLGTDGFDDGPLGPRSELSIANGATRPSDATDIQPMVDFIKDPTAINKAWTATGSPSCDNSGICGASLQKAYDDNKKTGSNFHNGFFVVRLNGPTTLTWDKGGKTNTPLKGKFFFYVTGGYDINGPIWPTTATNPDTLKPENVIFVYGKGKGGNFIPSFNPQIADGSTDTVVFTGYLRYDETPCSSYPNAWKPKANLLLRGAFHLVGPPNGTGGITRCTDLNINSSNFTVRFDFDQAALNAIGSSFGTNFFVNGKRLGIPPDQFLLMENWIQFRTLGELR